MRSNRFGCLSNTGILAALVTVLLISGYVYARGGLLFNPGPLNSQGDRSFGGVTSHAEIGGECEACHTAPWEPETMADRCIVCHTEIGEQMSDAKTVHGALFQNDPDLACRHCHPEHRGAEALLTVMEDVPFPHEVVGFSLNGHQLTTAREPFACDDCHQGDIATFTQETCDTCHRQIDLDFMTAHTLSFGSTCLECHDGVDRFDETFDHSMFSFQLTGGHAGLACVQCHINARTLVDFAAAPQDCFSCHANDEPHEGRFGQDCSQCHTVDAWTPAEFDHNLAAFKLEGKHAEVPCESCHINRQFRGTPMDCFSCHQQDDAHNGQLGTNCATCHNSSDWNDVNFDHNLSNFPLTGAHMNVACQSCHVNGQFRGIPTDCFACHQQDDAHNGQFGTNCAACHNTSDWRDASFDHNLTNFPLTGAHTTVACQSCHVNGQFQGLNTACAACHAEPAFHAGLFGTECAACHTTTAWRPAEFNGQHTFPLNHGGGATCATCHPSSFTTYTCYGCHEHNEAEIAERHLDKDIPNFQNCMECHPSGEKD